MCCHTDSRFLLVHGSLQPSLTLECVHSWWEDEVGGSGASPSECARTSLASVAWMPPGPGSTIPTSLARMACCGTGQVLHTQSSLFCLNLPHNLLIPGYGAGVGWCWWMVRVSLLDSTHCLLKQLTHPWGKSSRFPEH